MNKLHAYLQLIRPANIVTAMADVLAGFALANSVVPTHFSHKLFYLLICTIGLYGGGIIFNDVFDMSIDQQERPHRPLPSGRISIFSAALLGSCFFLIALIMASMVNVISFIFAAVILLSCLLYDGVSKKNKIMGPINMGVCRALNLCLGMSIVVQALKQSWIISLLPFIFITAVTLLSQEEVQIKNIYFVKAAIALYFLTLLGLIAFIYFGYLNLYSSLPVIIILIVMNGYPLFKIKQALTPDNIQEAIKIGIMSLIILDALYSIGSGNWQIGFFILLLLPLASTLAKFFYVT